MSLAVAVGLGALTVVFVVLGTAAWRHRRHSRRALASALTGEIAATLETIEAQDVRAALDHACANPDVKIALPEIALPRFVVYESNAGRLDRLDAPLQRQVVQLFDRLAMLPHESAKLSVMLNHTEAGQAAYLRHLRIHHLRESLDLTLNMADEVLLSLRPIMSPHNRAKNLAANRPKAA